MAKLARILLSTAMSALLGLAVVGAILYLRFLGSGPQLEPWHRLVLQEEFTADRAASVATLEDYRALEDRLFRELEQKIYRNSGDGVAGGFNRYQPGSRSDPRVWPVNWNRSFEFGSAARAPAAVLLLHGLTDSPYSLRALGEHLAGRGFWVLGLRLPGHGTAPSGLLSFEIEDMQAAVRLAMREMRARLPEDRPIYMVGYSNGATLAVDYSLDLLDGEPLPRPAGLILLSPALGISPLAFVGRVKTGLSHLPGLGRAAWQQVENEYDPYKYSSFSLHAGGEVQRLAQHIASRVARMARAGPLQGFPPVLAFLSTVDATVRAEAVVDVLFEHLDADGHELVLFDVNRLADAQPLLVDDPGPLTQRLVETARRPYALSVVTNGGPGTPSVVERRSEPAQSGQVVRQLGLAWPRTVFSLSHVALPFPPDDPLYGYAATEAGHIQLGRVEAYGENGVLTVPGWLLTRQRSNPFYEYLVERVDRFTAR